jgi:hypothetical protein
MKTNCQNWMEWAPLSYLLSRKLILF